MKHDHQHRPEQSLPQPQYGVGPQDELAAARFAAARDGHEVPSTPHVAEDPLHAIEREDRLKRAGQWNDPERDAKNLRDLNEFVAKLTPFSQDAHWGLTWLLLVVTLAMVTFCVYMAIIDWSPVGLILHLAMTGFFGSAACYHLSDSFAVSRGTSCGYESGCHWRGWLVIGYACAAVPAVVAIAAVIYRAVRSYTNFCG